MILAGRDTFIGRERIVNDIVALGANDEIEALALQLPRPVVARNYLRKVKRWPSGDDYSELMNVLLEPESYALRPFFLSQLDLDAVQPMLDRAGGNPLAYLIDIMVEREATKFGDVVEAAMTRDARERFVRGFLREVARTMADDQTEAIAETVLVWIVDVVGDDLTKDDEVLRILRNRAIALAFLERRRSSLPSLPVVADRQPLPGGRDDRSHCRRGGPKVRPPEHPRRGLPWRVQRPRDPPIG